VEGIGRIDRQTVNTSDQSRPVIVYDGECPFCQRQTQRIRQRDWAGVFEYLPRQTPNIEQRFPKLVQEEFNTGMRLIMRDGAILVGADAVYEIARSLPVWRWFAWLYRVPVLHGLCRMVYAWIAANRQRLGRSCDDDACKVPDAPESGSRGSI
jgi:predicted DCC family thiol-disulfide oxidoreductase YuxK